MEGDRSSEWAVHLVRSLHDQRPQFCDVSIQCSDGRCVEAHRAVLAASSRYFKAVFTSNGMSSSPSRESLRCESAAVPSASSSGGSTLGADEGTMGRNSQLETPITKSGRIVFKGSSSCMEALVEFLYLGAISSLEQAAGAEGGARPDSVPCHALDKGTRTGNSREEICIWLTNWAVKHDNENLLEYMTKHLQRARLSARSAIKIVSMSGALTKGKSSPLQADRKLSSTLETLLSHALKAFDGMQQLPPDAFVSLSREDVEKVLGSTPLQVPEADVLRAVDRWAVAKYGEGGLPADVQEALAPLLDPGCLTPGEFGQFQHLFPLPMQLKIWRDIAMMGDKQQQDPNSVSKRRAATGPSGNGAFAGDKIPAPADASDDFHSVLPHSKQVGAGAPEDGRGAPPSTYTPDTSQSRLDSKEIRGMESRYGQALMYVGQQGAGRPPSEFTAGASFHAHQERPFRYVLTINSPTYQTALYRGYVPRGTLRWRLKVQRKCCMFWMGVTSNPDIQLDTWAPNQPGVFMISEEGTCVQACSDYAVLRGPAENVIVNSAYVKCFMCIEDDDDWQVVEMELDTATGDLFLDIDDSGMQHVFQHLPTDRPLCPCVCAINNAQASFQILDAASKM